MSWNSKLQYLYYFLNISSWCLTDISSSTYFFKKQTLILSPPTHVSLRSSYLSPGSSISPNTQLNLGVILDSSLFLTLHYIFIRKSWLILLSRHIHSLITFYHFCFYQATTSSHLSYYNSLLTGLPASALVLLQSIFTIVAKSFQNFCQKHHSSAQAHLWFLILFRIIQSTAYDLQSSTW